MKTLYLDCGMGAAGDMLTASLLELFENKEEIIAELNSLGIPGVEYVSQETFKCGIRGTHMQVLVNGVEEVAGDDHDHDHHDHHHHDHGHAHENHDHPHHDHSSMEAIEHVVSHLKASDKVKSDIMAVYSLIAEAESYAHGVKVSQVHFHEVGAMDAVADISAVSFLLDKLSPEKIIASPINVGSGQVKCAHGILPVPAPATAYVLKGIPQYAGDIKTELCTPTGASLLKHFVTEFRDMPVMRVEAIGYGMGAKDFQRANCLRALLGETEEKAQTVYELSCNVDDMTGEDIGFAMERLFEAGALEVYTVPVGMKKSRPGILLSIICNGDRREEMIRLMFKHTTTLGIRENISNRYTLNRHIDEKNTPAGTVRVKTSQGYGVTIQKYEFEDIARLAREKDKSLKEIREMLKG